jgi:hypothetical protein
MEYRPLNSENYEIRLLTLIEGKNSAWVSCRLDHYSLVDTPQYTALSYCWGNPDITKAIIVNGVKVQVTINLEAALRQLQADGYSKVWVDALCINQNNREERSSQVLRMRTIYAKATLVFVWLGIETQSTKITMDYLNSLFPEESTLVSPQDKTIAYNQFRFQFEMPRGRSTTPATVNFNREKTYMPSKQTLEKYSAKSFAEFFSRPYWNRIWIIQEIVAGTRVVACCGTSSTDFENIEKFLTSTSKGKKLSKTIQLPNFASFRKSPISGTAFPLVTLLISSRASLSTDPRDKIFALLGLASDGEELVPLPNYKQSLESIHKEMARAILLSKKSPKILILRSSDRAPHERLPSWVPDWADISRMNRPWHFNLSDSGVGQGDLWQVVDQLQRLLTPYSRRMAAMTRPPIEFNGSILEMKGWILDSIDGISTQVRDSEFIDDDEWRHREMVQPMKERTAYDDDDDETAWAIAKSLCMDGVDFGPGSGTAPPGNYIRIFSELLTRSAGEHLSESYPSLLDWLKSNKTFIIDGQTLRNWMRAARKIRASSPARPSSPMIEKRPGSNRSYWETDSDSDTDTNRRVETWDSIRDAYIARVVQVVQCGMRLMITRHGWVGMAHAQAEPGDIICNVLGCSMPLILRESASSRNLYNIVGEAYLHPIEKFRPGIMGHDLTRHGIVNFAIE